MRYFICLFCCLFTITGFAEEELQEELILSTPDQLAAFTSESSCLIGGIITPLGGHLSLRARKIITWMIGLARKLSGLNDRK